MATESNWLTGLLGTFDTAKSQTKSSTQQLLSTWSPSYQSYDSDTGQVNQNARSPVGDFGKVVAQTGQFFTDLAARFNSAVPSRAALGVAYQADTTTQTGPGLGVIVALLVAAWFILE